MWGELVDELDWRDGKKNRTELLPNEKSLFLSHIADKLELLNASRTYGKQVALALNQLFKAHPTFFFSLLPFCSLHIYCAQFFCLSHNSYPPHSVPSIFTILIPYFKVFLCLALLTHRHIFCLCVRWDFFFTSATCSSEPKQISAYGSVGNIRWYMRDTLDRIVIVYMPTIIYAKYKHHRMPLTTGRCFLPIC